MRVLVPTALAIAASLVVIAPAAATTDNVTSAGLYNYGTARMTGTIAAHGFVDSDRFAGALVLQGNDQDGDSFSVVTYCFDLLHNIHGGFDSQGALNYIYTSETLSNDPSTGGGTGNALTVAQIDRMSGLARLGGWMFTNNVSDLTARMSAIQAAIWSVEYDLTASNFSAPGALGYHANYLTRNFSSPRVAVLVSRDAQGEAIGAVQVLGNGTVPEPASWALMVIGFGAVGFATRLSKRVHAVAA